VLVRRDAPRRKPHPLVQDIGHRPLFPLFQLPHDGLQQVLRGLQRLLGDLGAGPVTVIHPAGVGETIQLAVEAEVERGGLDERSIRHTNPLEELRLLVPDGSIYPTSRDGHPMAAGYRVIAEDVLSVL